MRDHQRIIVYWFSAIVLGALSGAIAAAFVGGLLSGDVIRIGGVLPWAAQDRSRVQEAELAHVRETVLPAMAELVGADGTHASAGVVLTSDGWVALALPAGVKRLPTSALVRVGNSTYAVESSVSDPLVPSLVYARLDAERMNVSNFGEAADLESGELVYASDRPNHLWNATAVGFEKTVSIHSADSIAASVRLMPPVFTSAVVANRQGEVVGLALADGRVIPWEALLPSIRAVLATGVPERSASGVTGLDLAIATVDASRRRGYDRGFLVMSVASGSAAAQSGIRVGDIILSLNSIALDARRGLSQHLWSWRAGDALTLLVDRGGEERELTLRLVP